MNELPIVTISFQIHWSELPYLRNYCRRISFNIQSLPADVSDNDFVLAEYYCNYLDKKKQTSANYRTIKMPVSVARILWRYWQTENIDSALQAILKSIDGKLLNANLRPEKPLIISNITLR